MRSLNVAIPDDAAAKLAEIARREYRRPREQATVLLLEALGRHDVDVQVRPEERAQLEKAAR
jgi:hypothetical protein